MRLYWIGICFGASLLLPSQLHAQFLGKVVDFLTLEPNAARAAEDSTLYPSKLVGTPFVNYRPETGVAVGIGANYVFKMPNSGGTDRTRTSSIPIGLTYTFKNQVLFYSSYSIFAPDEKYAITGTAQFSIFPRLFYGVGRNEPAPDPEELYESTQFILEPIIAWQVLIPRLFLGGGFRVRKVSGTALSRGDKSIFAGKEIDGINGSTSMGLVAASRYDTRNSVLNPQTGSLLELTFGAYDKVLGGTNRFQVTTFDLRHFWPIGPDVKDRDTDIFGVQGQGYISTGAVPLAELAQVGNSEILRGFYQGRFADRHLLAIQGEYRLNMAGPFGFVGFYALGDVEPRVSEFRLNRLRSAYGVGVRYEVDKAERLNLRADFANTSEGFNFYIQIGEAF